MPLVGEVIPFNLLTTSVPNKVKKKINLNYTASITNIVALDEINTPFHQGFSNYYHESIIQQLSLPHSAVCWSAVYDSGSTYLYI